MVQAVEINLVEIIYKHCFKLCFFKYEDATKLNSHILRSYVFVDAAFVLPLKKSRFLDLLKRPDLN